MHTVSVVCAACPLFQVIRTFPVENNIGTTTLQVELVVEWIPNQLVLVGNELCCLTTCVCVCVCVCVALA